MQTQEILEKLNENAKECIIKNRRVGPDILLQIINFCGLTIWGSWLILIAICDKAGAKILDINQKIEDVKDVNLLNVALVMASFMFFISAGLLIVSLKRTRRRTDKIKISLLVSEIISFLIGILLIIKMY